MIDALAATILNASSPAAQVKVCNTAPLTVTYTLVEANHSIPPGECLLHTFARPNGAIYIPFVFNRSPLPDESKLTETLVVNGGEYAFVDLGFKIIFWRTL